MKALSLWQPWASLWLTDLKVHETRAWPTNVRGTIAVHAAKRFVKTALDHRLVDLLDDEFGRDWREYLPTGALIGTVELVDCKRIELAGSAEHGEDYVCGDFAYGRYAWQRGAYRVFKRPIPFVGRQGFFNVDDALFAEAA